MKKICMFISSIIIFSCILLVSNKVDLTAKAVQDISLSNLEEMIDEGSYYEYSDNDIVRVIVILNENSIIDNYDENSGLSSSEFILTQELYELNLINKQNAFLDILNEDGIDVLVESYHTTLINGMVMKTIYKNIELILAYDEVLEVSIDEVYAQPDATTEVYSDDVLTVDSTGIYDTSSLSYRGDGTVVAVLDTGYNLSHSSFATSVPNEKLSYSFISSIYQSLNSYTTSTSVSSYYYSNKIPFYYDYAEWDNNVLSGTSDHGQHVAGIVAANDSTITGVAPNAQLILMKIFGETGGAYSSTQVAALEDCVKLDVDVINMSIGASGGFSTDYYGSIIPDLFQTLNSIGTSICVSAGNSYSSANNRTDIYNSTSNPDSGITGSPSSYPGAMTIANCTFIKVNYILVDNVEVSYNDTYNNSMSEYDFIDTINASSTTKSSHFYNSSSDDFESSDIENNFILIDVSLSNYKKIMDEAISNNALGIVLFDCSDDLEYLVVGNNVNTPIITVDSSSAQYLSSLDDGIIKYSSTYQYTSTMAASSSWGPLPSLEFEPDITSPGTSIYSCLQTGYGYMTGTSMAAPNFSGLTAVARQYIKEVYPNISNTDLTILVYRLTMSTADILYDSYGNPCSVRNQGAGRANIYDLIQTVSYLSVEGDVKTKVELYDDYEKTGVFSFDFQLTNMSNSSVTYNFGSLVATETASDTITSNGYTTVLQRAYMLSSDVKFVVDGTSRTYYTIAANTTKTISVTITLSNDDITYIENNFENGMYVEGFITLTSTENVNLSIPFLGFYGDWTELPIFDNFVYDDFSYLTAGYVTFDDGDGEKVLGTFDVDYDTNTFGEIKLSSDKLVISPKSSIVGLRIYYGLLRGVKEMKFSISSSSKSYSYTSSGVRKSYYDYTTGEFSTKFLGVTFSPSSYGLTNGSTLEVSLEATLDYYRDTSSDVSKVSFQISVDYEAPKINSTTVYKIGDKTYLNIEASDNHYLQAICLGSVTASNTTPIFGSKGSTESITLDISNYTSSSTLQLYLYDYVNNLTTTSISTTSSFTILQSEVFLTMGQELSLASVVSTTDTNIEYFVASDNCYILNGNVIGVSEGITTLIVSLNGVKIEILVNVLCDTISPTEETLEIIKLIDSIVEITLDSELLLQEIREKYDNVVDLNQLSLLSDYEIILIAYEEELLELQNILLSLELVDTNFIVDYNSNLMLSDVLVHFSSLTDLNYHFSNNICILNDNYIYASISGETVITISKGNISVSAIIIILNESTTQFKNDISTITVVTLDLEQMLIDLRTLYDTLSDEQYQYVTYQAELLELYETRLIELQCILASLELINDEFYLFYLEELYLNEILVNFNSLANVNYSFSNEICDVYNEKIVSNESGTSILTISIDIVCVEVSIFVYSSNTTNFINAINALPNEITLEFQNEIEQLRILYNSINNSKELELIEEHYNSLVEAETIIQELLSVSNVPIFSSTICIIIIGCAALVSLGIFISIRRSD